MTRLVLYGLLFAISLTEQQLPGQGMITTGAIFFQDRFLLIDNILWLGYLLTSGIVIFKTSINSEKPVCLIRFRHRTALFWYVTTHRLMGVFICLIPNGIVRVITSDITLTTVKGSLQFGLVLCALMLLISLVNGLEKWCFRGVLLVSVMISWVHQSADIRSQPSVALILSVGVLLGLSWVVFLTKDI